MREPKQEFLVVSLAREWHEITIRYSAKMSEFDSIQFRVPKIKFPDNDFKSLNLIKINPNVTIQKCEQIIDLLNGKDISNADFGPTKNVCTSNKTTNNKVIRKELSFSQNKASNKCSDLKQNFVDPSTEVSSQTNDISKIDKNVKQAFQVVYGKYKPYKKNKEWTFDGFVLIKSDVVILYSCSGKIKGRVDRFGKEFPKVFQDGTRIVIGSFECELCGALNVDEFESGAYFAPDETTD